MATTPDTRRWRPDPRGSGAQIHPTIGRRTLPPPDTRPDTARRLIPLLIAMSAVGPLSLNILVPALPTLVAVFATDPGPVQLTISLYLVGLAVSQLALGPLSDRFGRRPVVLAGLFSRPRRASGRSSPTASAPLSSHDWSNRWALPPGW